VKKSSRRKIVEQGKHPLAMSQKASEKKGVYVQKNACNKREIANAKGNGSKKAFRLASARAWPSIRESRSRTGGSWDVW